MLGSLPYNDYYELLYYYPDNNTYTTASIEPYKSIDNNVLYFNIPRSFFLEKYIYNGAKFSFNLVKYHRQEPAVSSVNYYLGTYTLTLTSEQETIINSDSDKEQLGNIYNEQKNTTNAINNLSGKQQETTQAVENLENTVTDTTLQNDSVFFPTLDVPDLARDGLTHIFDAFVLAFCSKTPEDIILPIPYTNKSITIPYNYTREMLSNYSPNLLNLITLFWWYWIARIIVFDIYDKMDKLQSGEVENLQKENVTTNML